MMENGDFSKRKGAAVYEAKWVQRAHLVRLRAVGILPCENYVAQLEPRPERVVPPNWDMVFWVQDHCQRAFKPFTEERIFPAPAGTTHINVFDAGGRKEVPIIGNTVDSVSSSELRSGKAADEYVVYSEITGPDQPPTGCFMVPSDWLVLAIYALAFGPDTKANCEDFMARECLGRSESLARAGEIPWPLWD